MFIVVESGSTKADWMVVDGNHESAYSTKGFNPYFHSREDILRELVAHEELNSIKDQVKEIFFYGASCSSDSLNQIIEDGLSSFFLTADTFVGHDLDASAYACYNGKPEIACIIGTGSNSGYYDGGMVEEVVPALGHILGDEASGNYFGKRILADYLYKRLPAELHDDLHSAGHTKETIIDNVYRKPDANVYIASFMPFLIRNKSLDYCQELIKSGIQEFIDTHVKCFINYRECEVNFVGSLAELMRDELLEVCESNQITVGRIIRRPLGHLVEYHKNLKATSI